MGAGRSRIPKLGSNYKPPVLVMTNCNQNLTGKRPDELQQLQQQQQQRNTYEIKIPCPVPQPYPHPVPVQVPVAKPFPVQIPVPVHVRIPIPIPVKVDLPVPIPIKVAVPRAIPVAVPMQNQTQLHNQAQLQNQVQMQNYQMNFQNMQNMQNIQNMQNLQNIQNMQNMQNPYFVDQFFHHHQQQQQQPEHTIQCCTQRVPMNDSIQDTQGTGKSFENIATADILGAEPTNNYPESNYGFTNTNNDSLYVINDSNESNRGTINNNQSSIHHNQSSMHHNQSSINHNQSSIHHNQSGVDSTPTKIFDASYMAPITTSNDYQQSFENMNTSFVSSMKTSYQSAPPFNPNLTTTQEGEPTQSMTSIKTIIKNPTSPVTILNHGSPNSLIESTSRRKSRSNNKNDQSDQSIATYVSSKHSSKKRTSAGADTYITPPFTPSSQSRNNSSRFSNNNESRATSNKRSSSSFPSSSMRHTVQFQQSSIHNSQTPMDNSAFYSSNPSGRTSFQTSTTYPSTDPTSITPFGGRFGSGDPTSYQSTSSSNQMVVPRHHFGNSTDMTPISMYNQQNNFMQFNKDPNNPNNPNNPNSKDFSYMLFNIKVFRTPKEQS